MEGFLSSPAVGLIDGLLQLEHILVVTTRKNAWTLF